MPSSKLAFHVRQDATPSRVEGVLRATIGSDTPLSYETVYERAKGLGCDLKNRKEPITLLKDLGILERKSSLLTPLGKELYSLLVTKPTAFLETMHVLHYTAWDPLKPEVNCFAWSYRTICDWLFDTSSIAINRKALVSYILERAMSEFGTSQVSFGTNSIDGVMHWLRGLNPSVLRSSQADSSQTVFTRRSFCPPETLALAIDFLYRTESASYQTNMLLDQSKQQRICRVCLLDPTSFDSALEWAVGQYDFLQRGTRGGWGSYILLTRQPQISDFVG